MATTPGYDPKKAALFNQLRQGGASEDAAAAQAGITDAPFGTYAVGDNGQMGAAVAGAGKVAGVDFVAPTAAETAESARFNQGLQSPANFEQVDYALEAKNPPSKVTPINYTTDSTETVSGGGSTNTVSGAPQPTPASRSLQPAINAKQAELEQFTRDNPSDFARKKAGNPPLSPEENQQRTEKLAALKAEKEALVRKQENAEAPGTPTVTTVPNTTTTTTTTTSGTTAVDTAVQSPGGSDPVINQQTDTALGVTVGASNVQTAPVAVGDEALQATEDAQAAALAEQEGRAFAPAPVSGDEAIDAANEAELAQLREAEGAAIFAPNPVLGSGDEAIDAANEAELAQIREAEGAAIFAPDPLPAATPSPDFAANPDEEAERDNLNAAIKQGTLDKARAQNTIANQRRNPNNGDWRVKLRLAPGADYLYNAPEPGILNPLKGTGIIFPYTPTISTSYKATYSSYDLTHSNYKGYYYQSSSVEPVTLSCPFTAQSTVEAEYLLAVIHFFKSVTKMFYGQDPQRGTPPPLVYLTGLGEFQFNEHPCVVQSFTYDLPVDVDYIRARSPNVNNSNMLNKRQSGNPTGPGTTFGGGILGNVLGGAINRLANAGLPKGGMSKPPAPASFGQNTPTYVPTKMTIAISLLPVQSRKQQSQQFSLRQYANGDLLKGGFW
jgi:hypothetical protein